MYGLGWFLEEYSGRKIVSHTGGVNGFVTSVTLIPEEKLGIIVFTNTDQNSFYEALKWEIADAYLGNPYRNYSKVYLGYSTAQNKAEARKRKALQDSVALKPASCITTHCLYRQLFQQCVWRYECSDRKQRIADEIFSSPQYVCETGSAWVVIVFT